MTWIEHCLIWPYATSSYIYEHNELVKLLIDTGTMFAYNLQKSHHKRMDRV